MTKKEALNGKPYAGNSHVRSDEWEVASCTAAIETEGRMGKYNNQSHIIELEAGDYNLGGTLMRSAGSDGPSSLGCTSVLRRLLRPRCLKTT